MRFIPTLLLASALFAGETPDPVTGQVPKESRVCVRLPSMDRIDELARELSGVVGLVDEDAGDFVRRLPLSASMIHELGLDASDPFDRTKPVYVAFIEDEPLFYIPLEDGKTWAGQRKLEDGRIGVERAGMILIGKAGHVALPVRDTAVPFLQGDAAVKLFVGDFIDENREAVANMAHGAVPPIPGARDELEKILEELGGGLADIAAIDYALTWKDGLLESEGLIRIKDGAELRRFLARIGPPGGNGLAGFLPPRQVLTVDFVAKPGWPGSEILKAVQEKAAREAQERDAPPAQPPQEQGEEEQPQEKGEEEQPEEQGEEEQPKEQGEEAQPQERGPQKPPQQKAPKVDEKDVRALFQVFGGNVTLWEHTTGKMAMGLEFDNQRFSVTTIIEGRDGADLDAALLKIDPDAMNAALKKTETPFQVVFEPKAETHNGVAIHKLKRTMTQAAGPVMPMGGAREITTGYAVVGGLVLSVSGLPDPIPELKRLIDRVQKGERVEHPHLKAVDRLGRRHNVGLTLNAGPLKFLAMPVMAAEPDVAQAFFLMPDDLTMSTVFSVWDGNIHWRGDWPVGEVAKIAEKIQRQRKARKLAEIQPVEEEFE